MSLAAGGRRPTTIPDVLRLGAGQHPERVALRCGTTELTYGDLGRAADECGRRLEGFLPGRERAPHVALLIGNSVEYVVAYFAAVRAGAVVVPLNPAASPERLCAELDYCDVGCLITTAAHEPLLRALSPRLTRPLTLLRLSASSSGRGYVLESYSAPNRGVAGECRGRCPEGVALLLPTSGTGGRPKRVMLSHRNLLANVSAFLEAAELSGDDRGLIALPLTSSGTNTAEMLSYLRRGMTVVLYPHPVFLLSEYCKLLRREAITVANVTPMILRLAMEAGGRALPMMSGLRKIFFASSPMGAEHLAELARALPQTRLYYGYGLTEASPRCTMLRPQFALSKPGSAGTPLRGVEVRVTDSRRRPLGPGARGEIAVRGRNVMVGYYRMPEATAAALCGSWLYTRDIGHLDEDGFLYVRGRADNVIVSRGVNISPEEVEEALLRHRGVREAFVTGAPDELMNEEVVAYVVRRGGARCGAAELKAFLRRALEPAKVPRKVVFVSALRHSGNLKLVRGQAAAPAGRAL